MKIYKQDTITILNRVVRLIGIILILAFIFPAVTLPQLHPVNLRTAGNFVVLAKTGITTTGTTSIVGDIGVSPIDHTAITGFGLILDPSGTFSTSSLTTGKVYAADYGDPTPTSMIKAVSDMETAYTDAAGRTLPDYVELYAGDITGQTLTSGLYNWSTGVLISEGGVTVSGSPSDVWIFQIAQNLTLANTAIVYLSGGAQASNIFWQVAGQVTLGTTAVMKGVILCQTQIVMNTGATLNGKALAQTATTLDANAITGTVVTSVEDGLVPQEFALFQNYPNPFNPSTTIRFNISEAGNVRLTLFNILGQELRTLVNENKSPGVYTLTFNASEFNSGMYIYKIETGSFTQTRKMTLVK
jgi:hypothetical protein